jgi:hypothetical protein
VVGPFLEQQDLRSGFRELRGHDCAAGTGPDDDHIRIPLNISTDAGSIQKIHQNTPTPERSMAGNS